MGKSRLAVAQVADLSLIAARKRQWMWKALVGVNRMKADIGNYSASEVHTGLEE